MLLSKLKSGRRVALRCPLALALLVSIAGLPPRGALLAQTDCPCSLWTELDTPATASVAEALPVELGVQFSSSLDGYITAIRFYKGSANTGLHSGRLWTSSGDLLGEVVFVDETTSGWQEAIFSAPVPVSAGVTYIASYHTAGH